MLLWGRSMQVTECIGNTWDLSKPPASIEFSRENCFSGLPEKLVLNFVSKMQLSSIVFQKVNFINSFWLDISMTLSQSPKKCSLHQKVVPRVLKKSSKQSVRNIFQEVLPKILCSYFHFLQNCFTTFPAQSTFWWTGLPVAKILTKWI